MMLRAAWRSGEAVGRQKIEGLDKTATEFEPKRVMLLKNRLDAGPLSCPVRFEREAGAAWKGFDQDARQQITTRAGLRPRSSGKVIYTRGCSWGTLNLF